MNNAAIVVRGARVHNLRAVDLELPRDKLIVFTGVSGSGKSSLAFDTLYAEGQRRYIESLSSYARQFLGQLPKPDVDYLGGLSPAISIQQKTAGRNPRSTVGTITEVFDFLRVLFARVGVGHCPECARPIQAQSREQIVSRILARPVGSRIQILAPIVRGQKGEFKDLCADLLKRGFVRARIDGATLRLNENLRLDKRLRHDMAVIVDRIVVEPRVRGRISEAVEQALALADGSVIVSEDDASNVEPGQPPQTVDTLFSARYACAACDRSFEEPTPQLFSFNSPHGMCPDCDGLGTSYTFDPALLIPDPSRSFFDGAVTLVGSLRDMGRWRRHIYEGVAQTLGIDLKTSWKDLPNQHQDWLLNGAGDRQIVYAFKHRGGVHKHAGKWEGVVPQLLTSFKKAAAGPRRLQLQKYMTVMTCPSCRGQRLNAQARAVRIAGLSLVEACALPIADLAAFLASDGPLERSLDAVGRTIATELLKEIRARIGFLLNVGLDYLSLDRPAPTLSGGEAQRIRLAGQIGSGLVGVLYILDEPSIGLHPRDNERLLRSIERLRDVGNSVIVVEHDEETIRAADFVVDFGPGPGVRGGQVVASGSFADIAAHPESVTGQYLSGRKSIAVPANRRPGNNQVMRIVGARHHNLKDLTVELPLGRFIGVTGVSGSGKSSLINDILLRGLKAGREVVEDADAEAGEDSDTSARPDYDRIDGAEFIDKVIAIDQSPIGRTPRSNPVTYIKVFDEIRNVFAMVTDAKTRGYRSGRFSFNVSGGRCEACEGAGSNRLEMDFLADIWVTCPVCTGRRFNHETLQVRYRGKSIHDVLEMDVQEALVHFEHVPKVRAMLQTLHEVGLDYLKLGQPSPTLSGGEAQRVKLARELCRRSTGRTLYVLDEPTTGLHFEDVRKLLETLHRFVDEGNTVVVIEHNLDVIKTADWVIDLGPEGGAGGGRLVVAGTPETVAACAESHTGAALRPMLGLTPRPAARKAKRRSTTPRRADRIDSITVEGARQHNLKDVTVAIPRERMTVCCGPSGSGKSTLAIDTVYAEGQRRYVESLSSYARQFLGQVQKPRVDRIEGLSPAVSIEQKTTSKSPRSTVGTVTEVYDYLRVLYARLGQPHCPQCAIPVGTQTADEIIDKVMGLPAGGKYYVLAPVRRRGQEKYDAVFAEIRRSGYSRIRLNGASYPLDDIPPIDHRRKHAVEVVIDRIIVRDGQRTRIADAIEQALSVGEGVVRVAHVDADRPEPSWKVDQFSQHLSCTECGRSLERLAPHNFSFNSPLGWCGDCQGLGVQTGASLELLIGDPRRSVGDGAVAAWPDVGVGSPWRPFAEAIAREAGFSLATAYAELDPAQRRVILYGAGDAWLSLPDGTQFQYKGVVSAIDEATRLSWYFRNKLEHMTGEVPCSRCAGARLRDDAAAVRFAGKTLGELCDLPVAESLRLLRALRLDKTQQAIASDLLREATSRLEFLNEVGLGYLSLSRPSPTLSGGEAQRIRLASQIGSGLTGVLYVLDEPTIGLHPRDNHRLLAALKKLRDLGNTLLLVEHDREVIFGSDHLLDFGPGAGDRGGEIVASGSPRQVAKSKASLTGQYLSGRQAIPVPTNRRSPASEPPASARARGRKRSSGEPTVRDAAAIRIEGARHNNLKNVSVTIPLGALVAVTGVSGSGKSSLVHEVLHDTLARRLHRQKTRGAAHESISGIERIDKVISVDQNPIGNTPMSNPATFTGVFDLIRQLFAQLPESRVRGFQPRRFSFNRAGGRCEACEGNGQKKIEMHFLPDVWVTCDVCDGKRFNPDTLAVTYKGRSIADVLNLRVSEAIDVFGNIPKIRRILQTLADVGLDYLALGQSAQTLSGGEAQRVKLAAELGRPNTGKTLYVLDEPTTGLHFDDVRKLLDVLHRLVDLGNTVVVVEHNLDVIKNADWVIDLGPEAGDAGGHVVAEGPPEAVAAVKGSHTGKYLAEVLAAGPHADRPRYDPEVEYLVREGDVDLAEIGADVQPPWESDGRRWHTRDRLSYQGKPCLWDGAALEFVEAEIQKLGGFGPTNWSERSVVEVAGPRRADGWFLHAMTGGERLLRLVFRVRKNTFKREALQRQLNLKPLNESEGVTAFGDEARVRVVNRRGLQEVTLMINRKDEVDTPAFREFLQKAAAGFHGQVARAMTAPEDVMPWKVDGERWHLGDKGFPPGRKVLWDRRLLPKLVQTIASVGHDLEAKWDLRDAVTFRAGQGGQFARIWTKRDEACDLQLSSPKGLFNLSRLEAAGAAHCEIDQTKAGKDTLLFRFTSVDQIDSRVLASIVSEIVSG